MGRELFDNIPSKVSDLLNDVKNGRIGLPDLQRPFVWKDNKVRELLDSMMKGYPIGYIMLWASPDDYANTAQIGKNDKVYKQPDDLVIDGQQRLTALLAAMYGVTIRDKNYAERKIRISFNPLTREFAVWTQAFERDPEWISEISSVFSADQEHSISKFRKTYIKTANEGRIKNGQPQLTEDEEDLIEENINDLLNLGIYSLPTLKINAKADEEDVADIFVRVNSGGQNLTEKNFIETLIAVYDNEVYDKINNFCSESRKPANGTSYNQILQVDPSHLIRVAVGVGFRRARLRYAYMLLRGKNLKTGEITQNVRKENLSIFKPLLHIYGASGSGTSTLGRYLAEQFQYAFLDADDYFWLPTDPKFTTKRPIEQRVPLIRQDIAAAKNGAVLSGSLVGWGDALIPDFTLAVRVVTDTPTRLARIKQREYARFGVRILPGGDMYDHHQAFLQWAAGYDDGGLDTRSAVLHNEWQKQLACPILTVDGTAPLAETAARVEELLCSAN